MLLKKGYSIRDVAKLTGKGISTIQRVKKSFYNLYTIENTQEKASPWGQTAPVENYKGGKELMFHHMGIRRTFVS